MKETALFFPLYRKAAYPAKRVLTSPIDVIPRVS
jgi:hypothetical protein